MEKDIIIIGGGPGGYVAAIKAAQLGAKVCLIEKDKLGGTCLNRGCIPTKALYRNAEILNIVKNIEEYGMTIESYTVSVDKIQERKQKIVSQLVGGIEQLLKANKIEVISGTASLKDKNTVLVSLADGEIKEINSNSIIISTGSKPALPPFPGADLSGIFDSEDILNFDKIPRHLAVVGGGVIGMEFAGIFNALGAKVTVIEYLPTILAQVDTDLTKRLSVSLKKKGIEVRTSTKVNSITRDGNDFVITAEDKKGEVIINADAVLLSTGRTPLVEGLNLEAVGIDFDKRGIKVDKNYETTVKGIYAIGDVNGINMLAHAASFQGEVAAQLAMGKTPAHTENIVPGCIFIFPEISMAGITEDEAKAKGISVKTSKFLFGANGKALALGEPEGLVKVVASAKDNTILGVHIMGPHASDLIHEGVLAVSKEMKVEDIGGVIHAHPTLSEAFLEAVLGITGEAIHMAPARK